MGGNNLSNNKNIRDTPVIVVPKGYSLEELIEQDDSVMDGDEPLYTDEVEVIYE